MSRILVIADIHIHDYPQRNPSEKYRLYQSRQVAQNVIAAAQREGATRVIIAGDILEKSVIRPYIQGEVKNFLDTIMAYFSEGYVIWGNHDMDNKGSSQVFTDSCLAVMLPSNLYYADQRTLTIENTTMAFSNWRPEFDLTWITNPVDVLFTHATISYADTDIFKSQVLDETKFDLCITGDIHKPGQKGKFVSIGTPQKCKMSDTDQATGIIFDCSTKQWGWVDLDPGQGLMKFEYTPVREEEGWVESSGIWRIYKPSEISLSGNGVQEIQIPAWEEIGNLVDTIIAANSLETVHGEILKNVTNLEAKEVDFNFTLVRFYCKNWRSIDEIELYFDEADKILITGKNGSGKSSLLSALRYAFEENRFLKDFIQFGAKSCVAEVDFLYQGSLFRIQRGTKSYGLWVNGEPQKYNNKREFEEDVRIRFPFIDYMADTMFFDSDHYKFIGSMSTERKCDVVSKFFKIDRIDAYNEVAEELESDFTKEIYKYRELQAEQQKVYDYISQKILALQLPEVSRVDLEQSKAEGLELQRQSKAWSDYQVMSAQYNAQVRSCQDQVDNVIIELAGLRGEQEVAFEIRELQAKIADITTTRIPALLGIQGTYDSKVSEYNRMSAEGQRMYTEYTGLDSLKICKTCGQAISSVDHIDNQKRDLEAKMTEIQNQLEVLKGEILSIKEQKETSAEELKILRAEGDNLNRSLASVMSESRKRADLTDRLARAEMSLDQANVRLSSLGAAPMEITLPDHFLETMGQIEAGIVAWQNYEGMLSDQSNAMYQIQNAQIELDKLSGALGELQRYIKITGPTGKIYEEIMTRLADQFSDNQVQYHVEKYSFRKKDHLDLACSFFNKGNWVGYQACSSGQQTVVDIHFMSKIITRVGILSCDELLRHLDPANHDLCIEVLSSMNIGCLMLSSHIETLSAFNNKTCDLSLNDSGITKIILQ